LANFRFRALTRWVAGTQSQSAISGFFGAGSERRRRSVHFADADYPQPQCGGDTGPSPTEWLLHALASCLTAGIATIAAERGIELSRIEAAVEGDIDLRGAFGLAGDSRKGFRELRIAFTIEGDAASAEIERIVAEAKARSPVFDTLARGVPVAVTSG
jgi:uncharacterized OsmC-like protein